MSSIQKKEYEKPVIRKVRLAPEEAVLAACKEVGTIRTTGVRCDNMAGTCINKTAGS